MRKLLSILFSTALSTSYAQVSGIYLGGGLGYGVQKQDYMSNSNTNGTPALRAQVGYQFADWIDAELGWNYISQSPTYNDLGNSSSTIYDFAFLPGFTLPATPITIFVRLGVDSVSSNLNSSWYNQLFNSGTVNFEYGVGAKVAIPETRTWIRAEYIDYGGGPNANNSALITTPTAVMLSAAYVF